MSRSRRSPGRFLTGVACLLRGAGLLLSASVLLAGCGRGSQPNVLLIIIDTARADRFTFNGYARDTTPRIDALAAEGAIYENAYTPSPWTLPAHASLFTGLYPSAHGADAGHLLMDDTHWTLAEAFERAGYDTVGYVENPWIGKAHGFYQGFDTYEEIWRGVRGTERDMGSEIVTRRVERYLAWLKKNPVAGNRPFFMFINYFEPHLPYNPPEPERSRFLSQPIDREALERLRKMKHPKEMPYILGLEPIDPTDARMLSDLYDGEIAYIDRRIGEVMEMFRSHDLLDQTVVVITSDHGEMLGEHNLLDHKLNVYEEVLRIPLVIRYPSAVRAGQRIAEPVMLQDLFPTLLGLARIDDAAPPSTASLEAAALPGVRGLNRKPGEGRPPIPPGEQFPLVAEYARPVQFLDVIGESFPGTDTARWNRSLAAYRIGVEKLHWGSDGRHMLFDLSSDPTESHDLSAERPGRVRDLAASLEEWLRRAAARPPIRLDDAP